jgi:hypothetical protein
VSLSQKARDLAHAAAASKAAKETGVSDGQNSSSEEETFPGYPVLAPAAQASGQLRGLAKNLKEAERILDQVLAVLGAGKGQVSQEKEGETVDE